MGAAAAWSSTRRRQRPDSRPGSPAVEQSVAALTHFIGADLRPDLGAGALAREQDVYGQADSAKQNKDVSDGKGGKENLAEG